MQRLHPLLRIAAAVALVATVAALARLFDVDLTAAALLLLVSVLVAGALGLAPGIAGATTAWLALNLLFTEPTGSLKIEHSDDVVSLVVFAASAALVGWTVQRLAALRHLAIEREHESRVQLDLTNAMLRSRDLDDTLPSAARALTEIFEFDGCVLHAGSEQASSGTFTHTNVHVETGGVVLDAHVEHGLSPGDQALLEALVGSVATAVDRLRLQEEVRDARLVADIGQQRAGFLSAVSHNLRTPLTAVKAAASTLLSSWSRIDPEERRELLETIADEAERLERLVRNTLELSRIRAGALNVNLEPLDIADLVQHAVRRLRPIARAHRVRLNVDDDLPVVALDVMMMDQILLNLLENALRFAPPGSEILVEVHRIDDAHVELRVVDHGPGVPDEARERIFEEFQSADTRPDRPGTGLGLAIVRALVTAQEGSVRFEPTEGGGADVRVPIPIGDEVTTILVVEDDPALRLALRTMIRSHDYTVVDVDNGETAVESASRGDIDLVVLDLGLPDVDGFEVLRRVRTFSDIPVIVLTAHQEQADKIHALDAGADDYVTKPFDTEELLARACAPRCGAPPHEPPPPSVARVDDLEIDLARRLVSAVGEPVHLTRTELELLEQLVRHPGKLLTQEFLLREVWGPEYGTEANYLRVYVGQLRKKLGDDAAHPRLILTEPGIGYRWIAGED